MRRERARVQLGALLATPSQVAKPSRLPTVASIPITECGLPTEAVPFSYAFGGLVAKQVPRTRHYSMPQENTFVGVTSTTTDSPSSRAALSGYCGYFT